MRPLVRGLGCDGLWRMKESSDSTSGLSSSGAAIGAVVEMRRVAVAIPGYSNRAEVV